MYTFKIGIPAEVHDTFVKNHPLCNLLQSSSWAKVKDNWGSEIVGVYEKDTLVASSLVLIKPLPAGFTMLYTPRGPVMDYTNERLVSYFMAELKKFGKKKRALFIKWIQRFTIKIFIWEKNINRMLKRQLLLKP